MNKVKFLSVLFLASIILMGCKKRDTFENNRFFDKTFNWEIKIPDDYEKATAAEAGGVERDTTLMKSTHAIVAFKKDKTNYFSANYEDYSGDVRAVDLTMKLKDFVVLRDLGKINPKGQMGDYEVTNENISGLEFRKAKITLKEDGKTAATAVIFSRVFNDKIFIASVIYKDEDSGKAIIDLFKQSTFKQ